MRSVQSTALSAEQFCYWQVDHLLILDIEVLHKACNVSRSAELFDHLCADMTSSSDCCHHVSRSKLLNQRLCGHRSLSVHHVASRDHGAICMTDISCLQPLSLAESCVSGSGARNMLPVQSNGPFLLTRLKAFHVRQQWPAALLAATSAHTNPAGPAFWDRFKSLEPQKHIFASSRKRHYVVNLQAVQRTRRIGANWLTSHSHPIYAISAPVSKLQGTRYDPEPEQCTTCARTPWSGLHHRPCTEVSVHPPRAAYAKSPAHYLPLSAKPINSRRFEQCPCQTCK